MSENRITFSGSTRAQIMLDREPATAGMSRSEASWYLQELALLTSTDKAAGRTAEQEAQARLRFAALRIRHAEANLRIRREALAAQPMSATPARSGGAAQTA